MTGDVSFTLYLPPLPAMEPPPTLEELVREVGISVDLLDQRCSNEHLKSISLFLDWRDIAPHLGLSERDIEDIEADTRTESGRRLKALQKWKKKYSYKATLKSLVVVLLKIESGDDAEKVCRYLKSRAQKGMIPHPSEYKENLNGVSVAIPSRLCGEQSV